MLVWPICGTGNILWDQGYVASGHVRCELAWFSGYTSHGAVAGLLYASLLRHCLRGGSAQQYRSNCEGTLRMYQSDTVVAVLRQLNDTYFLPAIQREFVWKPTQVTRLFDSIMQDYPIGSFLFWKLERESRDKWDAYQFLADFKQGGTHNRQADLVGIPNPVLVLDGQQRLTALLIGLRGRLTYAG